MAVAFGLSACAAGGGDTKATSSNGGEGGIPKPSVSCEVPEGNIDDKPIDTSKVEGEITFMTQGLQNDFKEFFEGQIKRFEQANPGTKIKWTDQGGSEDFDNLMATQAQGCKMADVINVPSGTILALSKANLLMDLDVKAPGAGDHIVKSIWDSTGVGFQGHHTAIPWYFGPFITTYNKDVFERAGLDTDKSPATMEERFQFADKIADANNGDYGIYGNANWYLPAELHAMGVKMMNEDNTEFTFASDPKAKTWLEEMAKLFKKGAIPPDSLTGDPDPGKTYNNGNLAFGTPNASFLRSVKENNPQVYEKTGVGSYPRAEGVKPLFNGQFLAISVTTKNAPLAMKFAQFVGSDDEALAWTRDGGAIIFPTATKALDQLIAEPPKGADDAVFSAAYEVAAAEAKDTEAFLPLFYVTGQVQKALVDNFNAAVRGDVEPQAALDKAQSEMNTLLSALLDD
nr:extracellular solute-binding protein [Bowdeniella massiliensis]